MVDHKDVWLHHYGIDIYIVYTEECTKYMYMYMYMHVPAMHVHVLSLSPNK